MKELQIIQAKLKAPKGQYNNFGKYKYRSAEDILEAVKPIYIEQNCILTISDTIEHIGERYYVKATVRLTNSEGAYVETSAYAREDLTKKGMDESQITGSTSSYARKYALNGLFAIDDRKEDPDYISSQERQNAPNTETNKGTQPVPNTNVTQPVPNTNITEVDIENAINDCMMSTDMKELEAKFKNYYSKGYTCSSFVLAVTDKKAELNNLQTL